MTTIEIEDPRADGPHRRPRRARTRLVEHLAGRSTYLGVALVASAVTAVWTVPGAPIPARTTLTIFLIALVAWISGRFDDTLVGVAAGVAVVILAGVEPDAFFATLGDDTVWLLVASFVLASAVGSTGLATVAASTVITGARSVTSLFWRVAAGLFALTFIVPATSGRAAIALPVFVGIARVIGQPRVSRALALLFPAVILLSASASLLGAGAHLITAELVRQSSGEEIGFARWAMLGIPFATASSASAVAVILRIFLTPEERRMPVTFDGTEVSRTARGLSTDQRRVAIVMIAVLGLWASAPLHGAHPAVVALLGALAVCAPGWGPVTLQRALDDVPWSLIVFLSCTLALGDALITTGAATWLADGALSHADALPPVLLLTLVVGASLLAHLLIGSRSARSSVLVPLVVVIAATAGMDATALAFASTVAAGFCLTLPVSAKPVAMFLVPIDDPRVTTFTAPDLLRLSAVLLPVHLVLLVGFSAGVWPVLGLQL